ncbi:metallophosphoesterase family protein [Nocardia otitidiscaviarum]|uniref:metallophosphoesterase family protein n=1 Tax=Nocardia otitidiscaviarum TaxID=1823 RepID=UPI001892DFB9|nr:metallophosphoesterase [Nocardia otitidiscaviarum]MBF6181559.1 metallophosphoesterase family protein [Nocardia otitidiscaviarum]
MGKVLIIGDLHGNTEHALALLREATARGCDRVFALGDFGAWEHVPSGRRYFDVVNKAARRAELTVYFLDGNHDKSSLVHELYGEKLDDEGFLRCRSNLRYAPRGHRWTWADTRFAAFGGAYSVDKQRRLQWEAQRAAKGERRRARGSRRVRDTAGTLWFPEEQMTDAELDALLDADSSPVDVLFTHDKPRAAAPDFDRKKHPDCLPNQDRIQRAVETLRPAVLFHGHFHYRYTDHISLGDDEWTRVEGLAADPDASSRPDYHRDDSWYVLPLPHARDSEETSRAAS